MLLTRSFDYRIRLVTGMLTSIYFSPTTRGLFMFMLCYKNGALPSANRCLQMNSFLPQSGGLAREQIRDALSPSPTGSSDRWSLFNHQALQTHPLGASTGCSIAKIALYFPRPEIVPNVQAGTYRYTYTDQKPAVSPQSAWKLPEDDARAIIESQLLSLRLRSRGIVTPPSQNPQNVPAQPRRVYLVGGSCISVFYLPTWDLDLSRILSCGRRKDICP